MSQQLEELEMCSYFIFLKNSFSAQCRTLNYPGGRAGERVKMQMFPTRNGRLGRTDINKIVYLLLCSCQSETYERSPRILTGVSLTIQGTLTTAIVCDILTLQMVEIHTCI